MSATLLLLPGHVVQWLSIKTMESCITSKDGLLNVCQWWVAWKSVCSSAKARYTGSFCHISSGEMDHP
eukprot:Gb_41800 [translate_table: standard]